MANTFTNRLSQITLSGLLLVVGIATNAQTVTVNLNTCSGAKITITNGSTDLTVPPSCVGVVVQPPSLTSTNPTSADPGTTVNLVGTNLNGTSGVSIAGFATTFSVVSSTQLTVAVPASAPQGSTSIVVTTAGGQATIGFIVNAASTTPPSITTVVPNHGAQGATFVLSGTNLAGAVVTINGVTASVSSNTGTSITATVPLGLTAGSTTVVVTVGSLTPASVPFTVDSPPPAPSLASFTPSTGPVGTVLTITGTNFVAGASVTIGGLSATNVSVISATSLTATVPTGASSGNVAVVTPGGTATSSTSFTVTTVQSGALVATDGTVIPDPSRSPLTGTPQHNGENGASLNAYRVAATTCTGANTPPLNKMWWHNIDMAAYRSAGKVENFSLFGNESLTFKFTAPTTPASGGFTYNDNAIVPIRPTYMTISQTPCDFDVSKANTSGCYRTANSGNSVAWANVAAVPPSYCSLTPGATYYFNVRFQTTGTTPTDSCADLGSGAQCGGIIQFQ